MSEPFKKKKNSKDNEFLSESRSPESKSPLSSEQLHEKYMHLETILMLTQLNSTYFELGLSLRKATIRLENRYKKIKVLAWLKLKHFRLDSLDVRANEVDLRLQQKQQSKNQSDQLTLNLVQEEPPSVTLKNISLGKEKKEVLRCRVAVECKTKLRKFIKLLKNKKKNYLSFAIQRILHAHDPAGGNILSEKSSRIDTNDSQKSKIFKRSVERNSNRKSFSLEKSGVSSKREYFVPIKYQRSNDKNSPIESRRQLTKAQISQVPSSLNKFLHDKGEATLRRRNLVVGSDKNVKKCSSSKKVNISAMISQKEQKIRELEYLRGKYKKLMDQFSWFSDRFLKVIEEEQVIQ